jgi:hypothetical protein
MQPAPIADAAVVLTFLLAGCGDDAGTYPTEKYCGTAALANGAAFQRWGVHIDEKGGAAYPPV